MYSGRALPRGAGLSFLRHAGIRSCPLSSRHQVTRALHWSNKRLGEVDGSQGGRRAPQTPPPPAEHGGGSGSRIFGCLPVHLALGRVGRGVLVALPLAGAGFATDLARKDYRRARHELRHAHVRLALAEMSHRREVIAAGGREKDGAVLPEQPVVDVSPARVFGIAAAVDSGVVLAHLISLYGLYQGWEPEPIVNAGIAVVAGALLSAGGGVRGEYLVARRELVERRARSSETPEEGGGARAATEVKNE